LEPILYEDQGELLAELPTKVIAPAEAKVKYPFGEPTFRI
jgi:hypothetical protein